MKQISEAVAWGDRLRGMPGFGIPDAEIAGCARLMGAYMEGARWTARRFTVRGIDAGFDLVPTIVVAMRDDRMSPICTLNDGSDVQILGAHLRHWGQKPPDEPVRLWTARGEFLMRVSPRDWFRLAGVEETHHAISLRRQLLRVEAFPARSLAEYHAREVEFQAMEFKVAFAEERRLPIAVRSRLRSIRAGAARLRPLSHAPRIITGRPVRAGAAAELGGRG